MTTTFTITCTNLDRGKTWSYDISNIGDRADADAYVARVRRHEARIGRRVEVTVAPKETNA